jgi:thiopurine S-methyltransferase
MNPDFWHNRWAKNEIGFHEGETNALLRAHFAALQLPPGSRIFVPLCGKTRDIAWLLAQGFRVAGAELSELAIRQLFDELGVAPVTSGKGPLLLFAAPGLDVFVGDIFDLTRETLGPVDAIYDRAALFALPPGLRDRYAAHLAQITGTVPQLLISFEFDQALRPGPPFSVDGAEVARVYAGVYHPSLLAQHQALARGIPAQELAWILRPAATEPAPARV